MQSANLMNQINNILNPPKPRVVKEEEPSPSKAKNVNLYKKDKPNYRKKKLTQIFKM
jgi:hypothetical protein